MRGVAMSVLAGAVALCASPSWAAPVWRGYSFGMGREAARAVPGIAWEADNEVIPGFVVVSSAAPIQMDGTAYDVSLSFKPASHLHEITFTHRLAGVPADACRSMFEAQLVRLEKTYGAFSPRPPARNETAQSTRQMPGSGSSYATLVQDVSGTAAAEVAGSFVKLSAVRDTGAYTVFLDTVWTTKDSKCTSIRYRLQEN